MSTCQRPQDNDFNELDIFFQDPNIERLPPEEVRIEAFEMTPWEEGQPAVHVMLRVTPFQKRPSAEILILNPQGETVAEASIFGAMGPKSEINMHLRGHVLPGEYTARCTLFYERYPAGQKPGEGEAYVPPETLVVDEAKTTFEWQG